jgi:PleD family two-component response regulator
LLADRVAAFMESADFFRENGIGFSGGIATTPQHCQDPEDLIKMADKALYRAKFAGKRRTLVYEPE